MANAVSYEFLKALMGAPNGIPTLDGDGEIPITQLPEAAVSPFRGRFAEIDDLEDVETPKLADYAFVDESTSFWFWNPGLTTAAWVNQEINEEDYIALSPAAKAMIPYLVVPPAYNPPPPPPPEPDPEP